MGEATFAGNQTPGPSYKIVDTSVFKKRSESVRFEKVKTFRLDKIKRTDQTDFFET